MRKAKTGILTIVLMSLTAIWGCETTNNDPNTQDTWVSEDYWEGDGVLTDSMSGDTTTAPPETSDYRYIRLRDGFSEQLVDCNGFNPGADIDAIAVMAANVGETELQVQGYCETVTYISAESLDRSFCEGKNPSEDELVEATGAPDTCPGAFDETADCPGWAGKSYFQLNGGEIVCDLGDTVRVYPGDTLVVYEVFNPEKKEETAEPWTLYLGTANDGSGSWEEVGEGIGVGSVVVPGAENMF